MFEMTWGNGVLGLAALLAGAVNSIAGGGTLLTFPALMATLRNRVGANITSTLALMPGSLAGAAGYRQELREMRRWLVLLIGPSLVGGLVGALLLVALPAKVFDYLVPWLILSAALLFLFQPWILKWSRVGTGPNIDPSRRSQVFIVGFQFLVSVYGGYFGAGIGILMLSGLGLMGLTDVHRMNALKTVLAAGINATAILVFLAFDLSGASNVAWRVVPLMVVASVLGGYLGARAARKMNRNVVRWAVSGIGLALAVYYFIDVYG